MLYHRKPEDTFKMLPLFAGLLLVLVITYLILWGFAAFCDRIG